MPSQTNLATSLASNPNLGKHMMNGPIPGENFTSDTKNYPWHRPPEYTNMDDAIDFAAKRILDKKNAFAILTMLQMGMTVTTAADTFVTTGIGGGKWTPDFALLLAGPVAHIIKLVADGYGIDYEMGYDDTEEPMTINRIRKPEPKPIKEGEVTKAVSSAKGGLMDIKDQAGNPSPLSGGFMDQGE